MSINQTWRWERGRSFWIVASFRFELSVNAGTLGDRSLSSGTFYSLTMAFVLTTLPRRLIIFGIAAYASGIVFVSNIASAIEGWYVEHFSWHWIFWTAALLTPLMMLCVYHGIPRKPPATEPRPSWRGFAYFSFGVSLLYGVLDQGERLDWLGSGIIVAMLAAGVLVLAIGPREASITTESDTKACLSQPPKHHHPRLIRFRIQICPLVHCRARARVSE